MRIPRLIVKVGLVALLAIATAMNHAASPILCPAPASQAARAHAPIRNREEVEVLGRPRREVLRKGRPDRELRS